jgi:hypothetical protein
MFGWISIFALMFLLAACFVLANYSSGTSLSLKVATVTFGTLLIACLITRVARGRV